MPVRPLLHEMEPNRRPMPPLPLWARLPAHVLEGYERDLHDERMAEHAATQEGDED